MIVAEMSKRRISKVTGFPLKPALSAVEGRE